MVVSVGEKDQVGGGGDEPDQLNISILRHVNGTHYSQRWLHPGSVAVKLLGS